MPGGGLIALTKYGNENVTINGNPQFSYFSKIFRRYMPFSLESCTFAFNGPDELNLTQSITIRRKIERVADLVTDAYFLFDLPEIYCKYIDLTTAGRDTQYNFQWVNFIGASIIDKITFTTGGQRIQEFDGLYMVAKAHTDMQREQLDKWKRLVGEVPELVNPGMGLYGGGSEVVGYPIVYQDPSGAANRPSLPRYTVRVPLPFWFTEDPSLALPLVALQGSECEIIINLRPLENLYTVLDQYGNRVRPGYKVSMEDGDVNNRDYVSDDSVPDFRTFLVDVGVTAPTLNLLAINPRLELTYVYLTKAEQEVVAVQPQTFLVSQVTRFNHSGLYNRQQLQMEVHNLGKRIFIVPRRTDSLEYRNAWYNFTNWDSYPYPPYLPSQQQDAFVNLVYSSGRLVPAGQQDIIRGIRFLIDGNEMQEEKDISFFTDVIPYKYLSGPGMPGLAYQTFNIQQSPIQPAGTINFSLIRKFQAEVDVWPLPQFPNYLYNVDLYVETYNHFVVSSGMGDMKYAL
jgi:hypothetical protein